MDEHQQKAGEVRVQRMLTEPLERLGLTRPASMNSARFDEMKAEVCKRLAYMSEAGLGALAEVMAGQGGGKGRDRFPIGQRILEEAMKIEPPTGDDASPLIRKVFAHQIGQRALAEGWAPDLMVYLSANRKWPGQYLLGQIASGARENVRRFSDLCAKAEREQPISPDDRAWFERRRAAVARCQNARALGLGESGRVAG